MKHSRILGLALILNIAYAVLGSLTRSSRPAIPQMTPALNVILWVIYGTTLVLLFLAWKGLGFAKILTRAINLMLLIGYFDTVLFYAPKWQFSVVLALAQVLELVPRLCVLWEWFVSSRAIKATRGNPG